MAEFQGLPVFSYVDEKDQIKQIADFFVSIGATDLANMEVTDENTHDSIIRLIEQCAVTGRKMDNDGHVENLLNSLCSLIVTLPADKSERGMSIFCDQLSSPDAFGGVGWQSKAGAAVRVLSNLFHGFDSPTQITCRFTVYMALLGICARAGLIQQLPTDLPTVLNWFNEWKLNVQQRRDCLRLLMESLRSGGQTEQPAKVMLELLATYTDSDATTAVSDAEICVRTAITDPQVFLMDHLLVLRPVQLIETRNPLLWKLLNLFVSGTLSDYRAFVSANPTFVSSTLKVDDAILIEKMRMLTFMTLAERQQVVPFNELAAAVDLPVGEQLEDFVIRAIQANAVQAKMDQVQQRCVIRWAQQRRFDQSQWQALRARLDEWAANLKQSKSHLDALETQPQLVMG